MIEIVRVYVQRNKVILFVKKKLCEMQKIDCESHNFK